MRRSSLPIRVSFGAAGARGGRKRSFRRLLRVEHLEVRCLLAADLNYSNEFDPNQILIELAETANPAQIVSQGSQQIGQSSWWTVPVQGDVESTVAMYQHLQGVVAAMPDYVVELANHDSSTSDPNDGMFQGKCLWGLDNHTGDGGNVCGFTSGTTGADINALDAWSMMGTNSTDVIVAVIDTGVDYNHPDLAGNIWSNTVEIAGNRKDDDGNGYVDDVRGWDFVGRGDNDPMDLHGHGTHVSGTIGAVGNNDGANKGIVGVAYNNVKIMPLRVFDARGSGKTSSVIAAINYAVANGAKISNNSYTIGGLQNVVDSATAAGQHLFIAAAGNSGTPTPQVPASYTPSTDGVISVAASTRFDTYASFSSYGTTVDLAAPGDLIWSTFPVSLDRSGDGTQDGYRRMSGTSMASPHVAGVAALIWAQNPTLSSLDVKARILGSVDHPANLTGNKTVTNDGRLNAAGALVSAAMGAPISGGSVSSTGSPPNGNGQSAGNEDAIAIISFEDILLACPVVLIQLAPEQLQQRIESDDSSSFRETFVALPLIQVEEDVMSSQPATILPIVKEESRESTANEDRNLTDSVFADLEDWTLV